MASLSTKIILYVVREVNFPNDVFIQNDGQGDYIVE